MIGVIAAAAARPARGNLVQFPYSASATGATEITLTINTASTYAGVEWGVSPNYTWSAFDAEQGTAHTFVLNAGDGIEAATTYAYRFYETTDPLDAPGSRVSTYSGTVSTA